MISLYDLKNFVAAPVLIALDKARPGMDGQTPRSLCVGTALQESVMGGNTFLMQRARGGGYGPARGVTMIEPLTGRDIVFRWLEAPKQSALKSVVQGLMTGEAFEQQLVSNLSLAFAITRLRYAMMPDALPTFRAVDLAQYYKDHFNTSLGAAVVNSALISKFQQAMDA